MTEKQQERLATKLVKELKPLMPSFVRLNQYRTLNRHQLDGPAEHFIRFDCDLGTVEGIQHVHNITLFLRDKHMTSQEALGQFVRDLGLACFQFGEKKTRRKIACDMLRSAGLDDIVYA